MKPAIIILLTLCATIGILFVSIGGCVISTVNQEVELRTTIRAKSTANEASLDTMWKVIKQKANISQQAVSDIKEMNTVYEELVSGREGGTLFKMVTENYPDLKQEEVSKLYREVMNSVEAERKVFKRDQTTLLDIVRERESLIRKFPSSIILSVFGDNTPFERKTVSNSGEYTYVFVTSSATSQMVDGGEENNIELFKVEGN